MRAGRRHGDLLVGLLAGAGDGGDRAGRARCARGDHRPGAARTLLRRLGGTGVANYSRVWAADQADAGHPAGGVEPADAVLERATALVTELERRFADRDILLVSHGDTLQILQAGFQRVAATSHRSLPHLGTAEIRPLSLAPRAESAA